MSQAEPKRDCVHPDARNNFPVGFMNSIVKYIFFTAYGFHDCAFVNTCIFFI